jgi:carboxymethylenebutenolidase
MTDATTKTHIATTSGRMPLSVARPDGDPRGAVLVVQEAFGVNDHIEDVARRFAAEGYLAVAPHLFYRTEPGELPYTDFERILPHARALTAEGILDDVDATLGWLDDAGLPVARTAIVGFCMGGSIALFVGAQRALGAAVTFYGGGVAEARFGMPPLVDVAGDLQTPWLGLYGDADKGIPVEQVEQLRTAAGKAPVDTELVRYPGADHGFHCDARPNNYNEKAARDAWQRALGWIGPRLDG